MRFAISAVLLFLTSTLFASPVITSVTPNAGSVAGGTTVVIRGSGFSDTCAVCDPHPVPRLLGGVPVRPEKHPIIGGGLPVIRFGNAAAAEVTFIDSTMLEVVTPPHPPANTSVSIEQYDLSNPNHFTLPSAFTFEGDIYEAFDPILFPIFLPPVYGNFGSEFHTRARILNESFSESTTIYGLDTSCTLIDPPIYPIFGQELGPGGAEHILNTSCSQSVGRLFFVPKGKDTIAANLRVFELSKQSENFGVEVPVVHRDDFSDQRISILGVPIFEKFRNTLRIYSLNRGEDFVNISVNGIGHQVFLTRGSNDFEPSYGVFTDFPTADELPGQSFVTVIVDVPRGPGGLHIPGTQIWAFVSVTNNETQHITTITPN